ncbi:expressed unknown protein [Seminavis robusta]|uniref:CRAL-TRIO domain-containing protein n=1 Tax=Seminavis robusta TaxID=568900 RepID=A0A9N8EHB0_9STRA|nr:expressed unknown protein [Seminavis robusta]|eukprot:Sro994_g229020.1 n/a (306) ;mRNA; f:13894-14811
MDPEQLEQSLNVIKSKPIDPLMQLTEMEIARAVIIKASVERDNRLQNRSDFEYVQYALTNLNETVDQVLERVYLMQCFRQEYRINDTPEDGVEFIHKLSLMCPGLLLAVDPLPFQHNYTAAVDMAKFLPEEQIRTDEDLRVYMGGTYYQWNSLYPNFMAIRQGWTMVCECEGTTMASLDPELIEKLGHHLFKSYPKNQKNVFLLNTPTAINMWWALFKKFVPYDQKGKYHLGQQIEGFEGHRIDGLYKTPTEEAGRQKMISHVHEFLTIRKKNEADFCLMEAALQILTLEEVHLVIANQKAQMTS